MHPVSSILRRRLLQRQPVAIAGIGTFRFACTGVRLLPGRRIEPPGRVPELSPTQPGDTYLQEVVAQELGIDAAAAIELCRQWNLWILSGEGQEGNAAWLEGIGRIRLSTLEFLPDPEFLAEVNPLLTEPLVVTSPTPRPRPTHPPGRRPLIRPKGRNTRNYTGVILSATIALAAVGYLAYYLWSHAEWLVERFGW